MASFSRALGAGVKIAAGSDSPYSGGFTLVDELKAMVAHEILVSTIEELPVELNVPSGGS